MESPTSVIGTKSTKRSSSRYGSAALRVPPIARTPSTTAASNVPRYPGAAGTIATRFVNAIR